MNKYIKIYNLLKDGKYHTIKEIILVINVSDKTARNLMKDLKEILSKKDIELSSVRSKGYILKGNLLDASNIFDVDKIKLPTTSE